MKKLLAALLIIITSCSSNKEELKEVNLYSQRHYSVDEVQYKNFEDLTGIKVNVVKANADELIERLKNEGENSPADLFITVDAGKGGYGAEEDEQEVNEIDDIVTDVAIDNNIATE